jgi:hypothetical protein
MKTITRRIKPIVFQPFELTLSIETQEEYNDMLTLFSYYTNLADIVDTSNSEVHNRMTHLCMNIYDALQSEDQY